MAKKQNKPVKEETLETILFNCRRQTRLAVDPCIFEIHRRTVQTAKGENQT